MKADRVGGLNSSIRVAEVHDELAEGKELDVDVGSLTLFALTPVINTNDSLSIGFVSQISGRWPCAYCRMLGRVGAYQRISCILSERHIRLTSYSA